MAKHKIVCPISGTACIECAIYRGRHYYLCYSKSFRGTSFDPERMKELKAVEAKNDNDKTFGMPKDIEVGPQCINNFEEYVIEKEFAALEHHGTGRSS